MVRSLAQVAGVLGGLLWVLRLVVDRAVGVGPTTSAALLAAGAVLLAVAVLELGLRLVDRAPGWLRVVVAVGVVALTVSVVIVVRGSGESVVVDGALGVLGAVVCGLALRRRGGARAAAPAPAAAGGGRGGHRRAGRGR